MTFSTFFNVLKNIYLNFFHIYAVMPACVDRYYDTVIGAKVSSLLRLLTKTDGEEQSVQQVHNDNAIRSPIRSPVVVDDPAHLLRGHRSKPPVRLPWPDDRPLSSLPGRQTTDVRFAISQQCDSGPS